jgi:hypothetical protein
MSTEGNRYYTPADRALLWSFSGGLCAFPECGVRCVQQANDNDRSAIIGNIAHIEANSDSGPRANPHLPHQDRNLYENLILLCATHHALVDAQPNTYTVEILRTWKTAQEVRYNEVMAQAMPYITFAALEEITNALVNGQQLPPSPITIIPLQDKIDRNGLTGQSILWFNMGLMQIQQVQEYVETTGSRDRTFVGRLTSGFIGEYQQQRLAGLQGDALFAAMFQFSTQGRTEFQYQSAGLAVLVYLFERCEVFEQ